MTSDMFQEFCSDRVALAETETGFERVQPESDGLSKS